MKCIGEELVTDERKNGQNLFYETSLSKTERDPKIKSKNFLNLMYGHQNQYVYNYKIPTHIFQMVKKSKIN